MAGEGDRSSPMSRASGWAPPLGCAGGSTAPADDPDSLSFVAQADWLPPIRAAQLGEHPAHRYRGGTLRALRSRSYLLLGIAVAAALPLVVGMTETGSTDVHPGLIGGPPPAFAHPVPESSTPSKSPTPGDGPAGGDATPSPPPADPASSTPFDSPKPPPPRPGTGAPNRSPSAPVVLSVEAEGQLAERHGTATPRDLASASGGRIVTGIGAGEGNFIRFAVTAPSTGVYTVQVHYVATEPRHGRFTINDRQQRMVRFAATGDGWGTVGTVSLRLTLQAGVNTIEFGNRDAPAPDLDRIVISG
ncbi:MAG TPA: hypothetical protein VF174_07670 [Micromonosporaceae bacterium]